MIQRPVFKQHFQVEHVPSEGVFLLSEQGHFHLSGQLFEKVAPLINGWLTSDQIAVSLADSAPMAETYYALLQLEEQGYITEADFLTPLPQAAFWSSVGLSTHEVWDRLGRAAVSLRSRLPGADAVLTARLWQQGLRVTDDGDLEIVVAEDYLAPDLVEINAAHLRTGRPWMLVKPVGTVAWIGPLFVPGRTACWECLAQRLRGHRDLETLLRTLGRPGPFTLSRAALPTSVDQAVSLAVLHAVIWLARGGNPALEGRVIAHDIVSLTATAHAVVKRPQCPACGDRDLLRRGGRPVALRPVRKVQTRDGGHRAESPEQMLARFAHHISPVSGVIASLTPLNTGPDFPLKVYAADHNFALMHDIKFFLREGIRSNSAGKGMTDVQARASAVGEGIERYSGVFRGEEARMKASRASLGGAAIHPNECMLFSARQFAEREAWLARESRFQFVPLPMPDDAILDWTTVWSLREKTFKYLPTAYLYYGYPTSREEIYCWADSNGCAAGSTLEEAILQGFLELIERDSVAIWWYNRVPRPAVDLDSLDEPYVQTLREFYRAIHREFWVLDLTSDLGIPAFAAVNRRTDHPVEDIIIGFGAHLDASIAVLRALTEMNQFMPAVLPRDAAGNCLYAFNDKDAIRWWSTATLENQPYLRPVGEPVRIDRYPDRSSADFATDVRLCVDIAGSQGLETLVLDQTRPDIGLPVAKVIVPGLRHFWARFAPGRLYSAPVELGWLERQTPEAELNPVAMFV